MAISDNNLLNCISIFVYTDVNLFPLERFDHVESFQLSFYVRVKTSVIVYEFVQKQHTNHLSNTTSYL